METKFFEIPLFIQQLCLMGVASLFTMWLLHLEENIARRSENWLLTVCKWLGRAGLVVTTCVFLYCLLLVGHGVLQGIWDTVTGLVAFWQEGKQAAVIIVLSCIALGTLGLVKALNRTTVFSVRLFSKVLPKD